MTAVLLHLGLTALWTPREPDPEPVLGWSGFYQAPTSATPPPADAAPSAPEAPRS